MLSAPARTRAGRSSGSGALRSAAATATRIEIASAIRPVRPASGGDPGGDPERLDDREDGGGRSC